MIFDVLGSLLGNAFASGDQEEANRQQEYALGKIMGIGTARYSPTEAHVAGDMDPVLRQAVMQALQNYQAVGREGFTGTDRAALAESQRRVANEARGQREAVLQRADAQGGLGSSNQLMAALSGQQAQADRAAQMGNQLAIAARQRALDAYGQSAGLAQQLQGRDDAIARFNAAARTNTDQFNSQLGRQQYIDNRATAQIKADAHRARAGEKQQQADATRGMFTGIGAGIDQGIMGAAGLGAFGQGAQDFVMGPRRRQSSGGSYDYDPYRGMGAYGT